MLHATVLLTAAEKALAERVRAVIDSIKGCCLETTADLAEASRRCQGDEINLLLVCSAGAADAEKVLGFVRESTHWRVPLPVIVLAGEDDPDLRLNVLRQGAVDFSSSPCTCGDWRS
jgi:DNA-binding NtrC family response regulator